MNRFLYTRFRQAFRESLCFVLAFVGAACGNSAAGQQPHLPNAAADKSPRDRAIPRYGLEVGQEITYEGTYEFRYDDEWLKQRGSKPLLAGDGHGEKTATTIWIVGRNRDGWDAVLRAYTTPWSRRSGETHVQEPSCELMSFVVGAEGRVSTDDPGADYFRIEDYFPRLPDDGEALRDGWESENPRLRRSYGFRRISDVEAPAGRWTFRIDVRDPMDPIVLASQSGRAVFDRERNLVALFEAEYTQRYGIIGKGDQTLRLKSINRLDDAQVAGLRNNVRHLSEARRAVSDASRRAAQATGAAEVQRVFAESSASIDAAREAVQAEEFREQIELLAADLERDETREAAEAEHRGKILGTPAPHWRLKDLNGREHTLADESGWVVVLDFWYRGCGPCMRAMPQLKELARQFAGRSVTLLGMNTDMDSDDARFVVEKLDLRFPTLLAADSALMSACGGSGFPTLVVIDQQGTIRYVHTGYSPELAARTAEIVEKLLRQE